MKNNLKTFLKLFLCLYVLTFVNLTFAQTQECFLPAHNFLLGSDDPTNGTYWTKPSTITDDTANTTPPFVHNVTKTFKAVGVSGQSNFVYGNTLNSYVTNGTEYLISTYVKYGNFQYLKWGITGGGTYYANFDIQNGTYTGTSVGIGNPGIEPVGGGWYRLSGIYTGNYAGIGKTFRMVFTYIATGSGTGSTMSGTETFYFTAPQVMLYSVTSPENKKYVPTTAGLAVWATAKDCNNELLREKIEKDSDGIARLNSNLLTYSEQADNAAYVKNSITVTANSTTAPDGTATADTLSETASTTDHYIRQSLSVTSGVQYSFSTFAKKGTRSFIQLSLPSTGFSTKYANFNLNNCSTGTVGSGVIASTTQALDGWCRVEIKATATGTASTQVYYTIVTTGEAPYSESYLGVVSNNLYVWGMQARLATSRPDYIQSVASSVSSVPTLGANSVTANALATDAVTEVKDGILGATAEGAYGASTFGGYIEKIKKYVANKLVKVGTAYEIKKDDGTTTYETGTTDGGGRTPSN